VGDTGLEQGHKSTENTKFSPEGAAESGAVGNPTSCDADLAYVKARWPWLTDDAIQQLLLGIPSVQPTENMNS
jgi:hypothetical protein